MQTNVVRQPIIGSDKALLGYEILYEDNVSGLYNQADTQAANAIEDFLLELDSDRFLDGNVSFITFTPNLIMKNIPKMFQPDKLVIQIEDNTIIHPLAQKIVYRFKKQGYRIALKGFEFSARYFSMLDVVDIIKVDATVESKAMQSIVQIGQSFNKQVVAYNVNTPERYRWAQEMGCKYMQGSAVAGAMSTSVHRMDHMQSNFFQLVVAVTKDEPDVDEIADIISRDVTLAFSLIKLVNSAYFALRNRARSVKQALVVLGLGQLKQWVYLLSFKSSDGAFSSELVKTSFLRANFCAGLSVYVPNLGVSKSEAYLMGMFSTLGMLMEVPLESTLHELPVADDIKRALTTGEGKCGELYQLVLSYEKADWAAIPPRARSLSIPENVIAQQYLECVEFVNKIWSELMLPYNGENENEDESAPNHTAKV